MTSPHRLPVATYADLEALPPNMVGEIVDGELYASPRPASLHALATSRLIKRLPVEGDDGPSGWIILVEPELHIAGQVMVPDLAGWRRSRMPEFPDVPFFEISPDWVCEVASPSTANLDRGHKMPHYARAGVEFMWIVDPHARTLEVFRLATDGTRNLIAVHGGDEKVRAAPFDAMELDLAELWAR